MIKKPRACVTPKRDRETYILTARDISNIKRHIQAARDILEYYELMPENQTGVVCHRDNKSFWELLSMVDELQCDLACLDGLSTTRT